MVAEGAFYWCESLTSAEFSEGLETIGVCAFMGTGLRSVALPASLRSLSQGAFAQCSKLKTVRFSAGLEVLGADVYTESGDPYAGVF